MTAFLFPPSDLRLCWAGAWVERESLLTRALRVFRRPRRHEKRPVQLAFSWPGPKAQSWPELMRELRTNDEAAALELRHAGPNHSVILTWLLEKKRYLSKYVPETVLQAVDLNREVQEAADQGKRGGRPRGAKK
jgi:hypothetical protein